MRNHKCKFYNKCKLKDPRSATCTITGGMYYGQASRPAGCYVRMEDKENERKRYKQTNIKIINMKICLATIALLLILIPLASSEIQSLGTFRQGQAVNLIQICDNCTNVNLTTIVTPTSQIVNIGRYMTKNGNVYNYSYSTTILGTYIANTCGDLNGDTTCSSFTFEVTPSGFNNLLGLYIIVIVAIYVIGFFGFFGKHPWVSVLGGMGMITLGLFTLNNGIDVYRSFITEVFSFTTIGLGALFSIVAGVELIQETLD